MQNLATILSQLSKNIRSFDFAVKFFTAPTVISLRSSHKDNLSSLRKFVSRSCLRL